MTGTGRDLVRATVILAVAAMLGFTTNHLSSRPLRIFAAERSSEAVDREPRITADELMAEWSRGRALLLLDVRSESSFAAGHSPRAIHTPASEFLRHYERLGLATMLKATEGVVVVCESDGCFASDRVAAQLRSLGHRGVKVLDGGWESARKAGLEGWRP